MPARWAWLTPLWPRNKISRKKQLERVWPYPMTKEKRRELGQGIAGLVNNGN